MSSLPNKYDGQQNILISNNTTAINTKLTQGGDDIPVGVKIGNNNVNGELEFRAGNGRQMFITSNGELRSAKFNYENLVTSNETMTNRKYVLDLTLNDHSNVSVLTAVLGDRLEYNGTEWVPSRLIAGQCYWENNLVAENGGGNVTTAIKLASTATISNNLFNVTHTSPNRLTIGAIASSYLARISWQISFNTSDNDRSYLCYIRKNNTLDLPESKMTIVAKNNVNGSSNGSSSFLHVVGSGDFFELWISPLNQSSGVTVQYLSMNIESIKRVN